MGNSEIKYLVKSFGTICLVCSAITGNTIFIQYLFFDMYKEFNFILNFFPAIGIFSTLTLLILLIGKTKSQDYLDEILDVEIPD